MKNKYYYELNSFSMNVYSIVLLIVLCLVTPAYVFDTSFGLWFALLIPYFCLHEILHSIGYVVNGAKFKNITYGAHLEKGILCCSCKQEINKKSIMWSLLYPFLFIGVITYAIGVIFKLPMLILLSIANISGCTGDIAMFIAFLKIKDLRFFEYDNPLRFGIVTDENLENKKFFGLKRVEENDFKQTIDKKVTISKASLAMLILIIIVAIMMIFG